MKKSYTETNIFGFILISLILCFVALISCNIYEINDKAIEASNLLSEELKDSDATADPDGYLNGKWNIWEFVGDYFSGLIE